MRVVNRPESTTWFDEIGYHVIKDQNEYRNVMQGLTEGDCVVMRKTVNPISFTPTLWFAVPNSLTKRKSDFGGSPTGGFIDNHFFYVADLSVVGSFKSDDQV